MDQENMTHFTGRLSTVDPKLDIALRYLATGESYRNSMYDFCTAHTVISMTGRESFMQLWQNMQIKFRIQDALIVEEVFCQLLMVTESLSYFWGH